MPRSRRLLVLPACLALMPLLPACRGQRLVGPITAAGSAAPAQASPPSTAPAVQPGASPAPQAPQAQPTRLGNRPGRVGTVQLSARDLAPVDWYVDARNAQWILGDDVTVEASREYFGQSLTINARIGAVERTDAVRPEVTIITLRFLMPPSQNAVENNPRVLIGTGLTISARRVLRVKLFKTTDADTPISLRVSASGDASRGRKERVEARAPNLQIGGALRRTRAGWTWG